MKMTPCSSVLRVLFLPLCFITGSAQAHLSELIYANVTQNDINHEPPHGHRSRVICDLQLVLTLNLALSRNVCLLNVQELFCTPVRRKFEPMVFCLIVARQCLLLNGFFWVQSTTNSCYLAICCFSVSHFIHLSIYSVLLSVCPCLNRSHMNFFNQNHPT